MQFEGVPEDYGSYGARPLSKKLISGSLFGISLNVSIDGVAVICV